MVKKTVNKSDKRFVKAEKSILGAMVRLLSRRRLNIKMIDICRAADITSPTIYAHYADVNAIVRQHERNLQRELKELVKRTCDVVAVTPRRSTLFLVLLEFVSRNKGYFSAMVKHKDRVTITAIFGFLRPMLMTNAVSDLDYAVYMNSLISIVYYWVEVEKYDESCMESYAKRMSAVRVLHY